MYTEISKCRICGNADLALVFDLGTQALTGVFPKSRGEDVGAGPVQLVKCHGGPDVCGLLQMRQTYSLSDMYGMNYGYRSGLNQSMVKHLNDKVARLTAQYPPKQGSMIIDIGSNDSTLLRNYPPGTYDLVGIDPTGKKFKEYYREDIDLIPDFFSAEAVREKFGSRRASIVTSVAMFYDLDAPLAFMDQIHQVLDDNGVWHFEQSYMPKMLEMNSYDTACHEHLEYYALRQIHWMTERVGFEILDVQFNAINGGSFAVTVAKKGHSWSSSNIGAVSETLVAEDRASLSALKPYEEFVKRVEQHRKELKFFLEACQESGKRVFGYGASTKGNVLLQYCGIDEKLLPFIAEVNDEKFGAFTPGTRIPIISERDAKAMRPDYYLVLPWHFRDSIIAREQEFLRTGGRLVFPLPMLSVVGG